MQKRMNEIHSSLLLFLHRLRVLILHDAIRGETHTMKRSNGEDENIVIIEQSFQPSRISFYIFICSLFNLILPMKLEQING